MVTVGSNILVTDKEAIGIDDAAAEVHNCYCCSLTKVRYNTTAVLRRIPRCLVLAELCRRGRYSTVPLLLYFGFCNPADQIASSKRRY